jgi:hypothetical protein
LLSIAVPKAGQTRFFDVARCLAIKAAVRRDANMAGAKNIVGGPRAAVADKVV